MLSFPHGDPLLVVVRYEAEVIVGTFRVTWTVGVQVLNRRKKLLLEDFSTLYALAQLQTVDIQPFSMQEHT